MLGRAPFLSWLGGGSVGHGLFITVLGHQPIVIPQHANSNTFHKDVPTAIHIISDILQSSKLDSSVVEHEHDDILCKQREVDKQLERWSKTTFMELLFKICVPQHWVLYDTKAD